jgi:arylsulfatase A-like enzyme
VIGDRIVFARVTKGLLLLLAAALLACEPPQRSHEPTPGDLSALRARTDLNVVFVLVDTLRADRLGAYGYSRETSPHLDALAARGVRFENVESQSSWTKSSMASLWTGRYPHRTGVLRAYHALPQGAIVPAEILRRAGFRTGGVVRNDWIYAMFGFDQGFDTYERPTEIRPVAASHHNPASERHKTTDIDATDLAVAFIKQHRDRRFLLYIHYMDAHQYLFSDATPTFGTELSDYYDSSVHWTDQNIGILIDALASNGLVDSTIIVVASDHGEAFMEHGVMGHSKDLHREVARVPLIIALPGAVEGVVVRQQVANIDIWPTLLDVLGLQPLAGADGRSLVSLILAAESGDEPDALSERSVFAQLDKRWAGRPDQKPVVLTSVVDGGYRLIRRETYPGKPLLYDLSVDPDEQRNIAAAEPARVAELDAKIDELLSRPAATWGKAPVVDLDEMKKNQLRRLGYVVE